MKIELQIPFTGFYDGLFEQTRNEEEAMERFVDSEGVKLQLIAEWGFVSGYQQKVAEEFAQQYVFDLNRLLRCNLKLVSAEVWSPSFYNYTTDKIFCAVEVDDFDELIDKVWALANSENDHMRERIERAIDEQLMSYNGFSTLMEPNLDEWKDDIRDPNNAEDVSYLIAVLHSIAVYDGDMKDSGDLRFVWFMKEMIDGNTDLHDVVPGSYDSESEWELYQEYGSIYTDWALEHPFISRGESTPSSIESNSAKWLAYADDFMRFVESGKLPTGASPKLKTQMRKCQDYQPQIISLV